MSLSNIDRIRERENGQESDQERERRNKKELVRVKEITEEMERARQLENEIERTPKEEKENEYETESANKNPPSKESDEWKVVKQAVPKHTFSKNSFVFFGPNVIPNKLLCDWYRTFDSDNKRKLIIEGRKDPNDDFPQPTDPREQTTAVEPHQCFHIPEYSLDSADKAQANTSTVLMRGIPQSFAEKDICELLQKKRINKLQKCKVYRNESNVSLCFASLKFTDVQEALKAHSVLNNSLIDNSFLTTQLDPNAKEAKATFDRLTESAKTNGKPVETQSTDLSYLSVSGSFLSPLPIDSANDIHKAKNSENTQIGNLSTSIAEVKSAQPFMKGIPFRRQSSLMTSLNSSLNSTLSSSLSPSLNNSLNSSIGSSIDSLNTINSPIDNTRSSNVNTSQSTNASSQKQNRSFRPLFGQFSNAEAAKLPTSSFSIPSKSAISSPSVSSTFSILVKTNSSPPISTPVKTNTSPSFSIPGNTNTSPSFSIPGNTNTSPSFSIPGNTNNSPSFPIPGNENPSPIPILGNTNNSPLISIPVKANSSPPISTSVKTNSSSSFSIPVNSNTSPSFSIPGNENPSPISVSGNTNTSPLISIPVKANSSPPISTSVKTNSSSSFSIPGNNKTSSSFSIPGNTNNSSSFSIPGNTNTSPSFPIPGNENPSPIPIPGNTNNSPLISIPVKANSSPPISTPVKTNSSSFSIPVNSNTSPIVEDSSTQKITTSLNSPSSFPLEVPFASNLNTTDPQLAYSEANISSISEEEKFVTALLGDKATKEVISNFALKIRDRMKNEFQVPFGVQIDSILRNAVFDSILLTKELCDELVKEDGEVIKEVKLSETNVNSITKTELKLNPSLSTEKEEAEINSFKSIFFTDSIDENSVLEFIYSHTSSIASAFRSAQEHNEKLVVKEVKTEIDELFETAFSTSFASVIKKQKQIRDTNKKKIIVKETAEKARLRRTEEAKLEREKIEKEKKEKHEEARKKEEERREKETNAELLTQTESVSSPNIPVFSAKKRWLARQNQDTTLAEKTNEENAPLNVETTSLAFSGPLLKKKNIITQDEHTPLISLLKMTELKRQSPLKPLFDKEFTIPVDVFFDFDEESIESPPTSDKVAVSIPSLDTLLSSLIYSSPILSQQQITQNEGKSTGKKLSKKQSRSELDARQNAGIALIAAAAAKNANSDYAWKPSKKMPKRRKSCKKHYRETGRIIDGFAEIDVLFSDDEIKSVKRKLPFEKRKPIKKKPRKEIKKAPKNCISKRPKAKQEELYNTLQMSKDLEFHVEENPTNSTFSIVAEDEKLNGSIPAFPSYLHGFDEEDCSFIQIAVSFLSNAKVNNQILPTELFIENVDEMCKTVSEKTQIKPLEPNNIVKQKLDSFGFDNNAAKRKAFYLFDGQVPLVEAPSKCVFNGMSYIPLDSEEEKSDTEKEIDTDKLMNIATLHSSMPMVCARTQPCYRRSTAQRLHERLELNWKLKNSNIVALNIITPYDQTQANLSEDQTEFDTHLRSSRSQRHDLRLLNTQYSHYFPTSLNMIETRKKRLYFDRSEIHEWGLYTSEEITAGDLVVEYVGELIRGKLSDLREEQYEREGINGSSYLFRVDDNYVVDATKKGNLARFMNHSCDPNCKAKVIIEGNAKHIVIYARREISPGEEITYDYKFDKEEVKIKCYCGAKKCCGSLN